MISQFLRGLTRLYITAPLKVFDERMPIDKGFDYLQTYLRDRERRESDGLREFVRRAATDGELHGIIRHYAMPDEMIREILELLIQSALPPRDAIAEPFVFEYCAHLLSSKVRPEIDEDTRIRIWLTYKSPGFVDTEQQRRYATIFSIPGGG